MNFLKQLQAGALVLAVIVPAWWLGGSAVGSQWIFLALSAVALAAGIFLRHGASYSEGPLEGGERVLRGMGRPGMWCARAAGLFLLWVTIQALNPSHALVMSPGAGATSIRGAPAELVEHAHVTWLPSSLATPFARLGGDPMPHGNAWRQLLVFGAVAVFGAACVVGMRTAGWVRRALEWGVVQATAFSAVALAHNLSGSTLTYWKFYDPVYRMGGPQFPHDNQQVAYQLLLLTVVLAAGLVRGGAAPFARLPWRRAWLLGAVAVVYAGTVTCRPRSGLLLGTVLVLGALALKALRARPERRRPVIGLAAAGACALLIALGTIRPLRENVARFGEFSAQPSSVFTGGNFRPLQHRVAWTMIEDRPWLGWGGGSYLYLSPAYAPRVPEMMQALRDQRQNHRPIFPHADGDWIEFIVEYGLPGAAMLASIAAAWSVWMLARIRILGTASWVMAGGVMLVLAQAMIDPALRNPVVLGAVVAVAWLAVMLQRERESRPEQR